MRGIRIVSAFLVGHRQIKARLVEAFAQLFVAAELFLEPFLFAEEVLRGFGPIPKAGLTRFFEEFLLA